MLVLRNGADQPRDINTGAQEGAERESFREFIRQSHLAEVDDRKRSKNACESDAAERLQGQNVERYLHAKTLKPEKSPANDNCVCLSMRSNKDDTPSKRFATTNRKAVDKFLKVGRMTRCDDELSNGRLILFVSGSSLIRHVGEDGIFVLTKQMSMCLFDHKLKL
jgi:hypothetical protein